MPRDTRTQDAESRAWCVTHQKWTPFGGGFSSHQKRGCLVVMVKRCACPCCDHGEDYDCSCECHADPESCDPPSAVMPLAAPPPEDGTPTKRAFCYWHGEFDGESCAICVKLAKYAPSKPVPPTGEQGQGEHPIWKLTNRIERSAKDIIAHSTGGERTRTNAEAIVINCAEVRGYVSKLAAPPEPDARVIALVQKWRERAAAKSAEFSDPMNASAKPFYEGHVYVACADELDAILRGTR